MSIFYQFLKICTFFEDQTGKAETVNSERYTNVLNKFITDLRIPHEYQRAMVHAGWSHCTHCSSVTRVHQREVPRHQPLVLRQALSGLHTLPTWTPLIFFCGHILKTSCIEKPHRRYTIWRHQSFIMSEISTFHYVTVSFVTSSAELMCTFKDRVVTWSTCSDVAVERLG